MNRYPGDEAPETVVLSADPTDDGAELGATIELTGEGEAQAEGQPAALVAEQIARIQQRERERTARRFAQGLEGNQDAAAWLQQNRLHNFLERGLRRVNGMVHEEADVLAQGRAFVAELDALRKSDPYAFAQRMDNPQENGLYAQWRSYLGRSQESQRVVYDAAPQVEHAFQELQSDPDGAVLSEDDWEDLHPDNFADLEPVRAVNAMNREFRKRIAKQAGAAKAAPAAARRKTVAGAADAVAGAIAKAPPVGPTGGSREPNFKAIEQAYADNPTPANQQAYIKARAQYYGMA